MEPHQLINFLDPIFDTKIRCSCAVDDFYSAENLISNDIQKFQRGFMAYRVVKTPIELEFQLCSSIELSLIKIWPQIDSLKSTGFEIFVNSDTSHEYCKIASHFNLKESGIEFTNNLNGNIKSSNENFAVVQFYYSAKNQLRKVKHIKLVIKQTARCVPVIRRIEVWGTVSKSETKEQRKNIERAIQRKVELMKCIHSVENHTTNTCASSKPISIDLNIPDEFLDTITYELMAIPMVLPSGKVIDNSTLLKHTTQEEKWGRLPSDPFTGQPFTENRKPVLNTCLKSQIDSFLLKSCNVSEISKLPRTVGTVDSFAAKRRIEEIGESSHSRKCLKIENMPEISNSKYSYKDDTTLPSTTLSPSLSTNWKSQTLDEAIRSTLQSGKYTTFKEDNSNHNKCFQCLETISNIVYEIKKCLHLICRNCLVIKNISICKCGETFTNGDIDKRHFKRVL